MPRLFPLPKVDGSPHIRVKTAVAARIEFDALFLDKRLILSVYIAL